MPIITIDKIGGGAWGIVSSRREDIEKGSSGSFDRILDEEIRKQFISIDQAAERGFANTKIAKQWCGRTRARYLRHHGQSLYFIEDVDRAIKAKKQRMADLAAKKKGRKK